MSDTKVSSPAINSSSNVGHRKFLDEANKTDEALRTFTELKKCAYAYKDLGNANSNDFMECDCYEEFENGINYACGESSDCINRLTLIECVNGECGSCGDNCQNQRFQKCQYADIAVFKTQKKGYGVRCEEDIEAHQFIYEYIGEVITEDRFRERMIQYDQEGLKHFYFMMLQSGEFIDATKKGSLARFCNHSCNPNAYVSKWSVDGKLRMGIFANRNITKGEEITFDYNVDRYGATAQPCYCEEPNCIGFLGGKTQTDAASLLPQNYADALGVNPSTEKKWIKAKKAAGEKILKSEKDNINVEFVKHLELQPCESFEDVSKVMGVLLQLDDELIARRLTERLFLTKDQALHFQIIKLHGYRCFAKLLTTFRDDIDFCTELLEYLEGLPKTTKNGIVSSRLGNVIEDLSPVPEFSNICQNLLAKWATFETYKRITKKDISDSGDRKLDLRRIRLPPGWEIIHENGRPVYFNAEQQTKLNEPPTGEVKALQNGTSNRSRESSSFGENLGGGTFAKKRPALDQETYEKKKKQRLDMQIKELEKVKEEELRQLKAKLELENEKKSELERIIAEANQQKEQEREENQKRLMEQEEKRLKRLQQTKGDHLTHRWNKFFAGFVPNMIKHYEKDLSREHIKECARDIARILSGKELKKNGQKGPPNELSKEKRKKVKEFTQVYMDKFCQRRSEKTKKRSA
ncbi:LAMI_0G08350g1_1 [Lachancea mirantina]|uniref:Histone-lysine N-methyltransferase, H3 lysine-36 specific n=1 Tax=Lachancea mirantina TaxID=1230905 RepID=A0A1G4K9X5_9SACH|nr:LAMI_0G08350g1_1 [Lachancea mirantina]